MSSLKKYNHKQNVKRKRKTMEKTTNSNFFKWEITDLKMNHKTVGRNPTILK